MPSFLKFADFLQNEKDLTSFQKEELHSIIFQSYQDYYINAEDLSSKIKGLSRERAYKIIKDLILLEIIDGSFDCPSCDSTISLRDLVNNQCPECGYNVNYFNEIFIKVHGTTLEEDYEKLTFDQIAEIKIKNLARVWKENGFITYFLLDLVNSELVQQENEAEYNSFLSDFREFWIKRVLSQSRKSTYFIGEIGDAYKILFQDTRDALNIVKIFSIELANFDISRFASIRSKYPLFPRFKIVIDCVELPTNKSGKYINPESIFTRTANTSYDINSSGITQLYRAEAKLKEYKDNYYKYWESFDIALWLMNNAFDILNNYSLLPESPKNTYGPNLFMLKSGKLSPIEITTP